MADTVKPTWRLTLTIFVLLMIGACYGRYTGMCFLKRSYDVSGGLPDFEDQVFRAIEPFGFYKQGTWPRGEGVWFAHEERRTALEFASLAGARARLIVAVEFNDPSIAIRDLDNDKETGFVRALKKSILDRLEQHYGIRGLKFERQLDLFA